MLSVVKCWHRLPREAGDAPSLETFKTRLDGALSSPIQWKMSLLMAGGWTGWPGKAPPSPNHPVWSLCRCGNRAVAWGSALPAPLRPHATRGLNPGSGELERKRADELGVRQPAAEREQGGAGGQAQSKPSAARQGPNRAALARDRGLVALVFHVEGHPACRASRFSSSRSSQAAQGVCDVWRNPAPVCVQSRGCVWSGTSRLQEKAPERQMLAGLT